MAILSLPKSNEREKAMLDNFNVRLVEEMSVEEFENMIIEYLNQHNVLHLATCKDNEPRCTPLEYFNNGLTVYISSEGGGKFANLKVNSKVSFSISDPYEPNEDFFGASGLQVWGTASTFKKNDDPEKHETIREFTRNREGLKKQGLEAAANSFNFNIITIEPTKIRYLSLRRGFRNALWTREP